MRQLSRSFLNLRNYSLTSFSTPLVLLFGVGILSTAAILIRLADAPALTVAAWRLLIAGVLLAPWGRGELTRSGRLLAGLAGLFLALHFGLWIESLRHTSVASSVVLVTTTPIFLGLWSTLWGEPPGRALWKGIALAVAGGILIGWEDLASGGGAWLGNLLALGGAVAASGYLIVGRQVRSHGDLLPYVATAYGVGAVVLVVVGLAAGGPLLPQGKSWLWIGLLGLGPQLLGHTTFNWALRRLPAPVVAVAILGEPVGAALWAFLLFGEGVTPLSGVGMGLVLLGVVRVLRAAPSATP